MNVVKTSLPLQSPTAFFKDIAQETALIWHDPDMIDTVKKALWEAYKSESFIFQKNTMICNACVEGLTHPVHMFYKIPEKLTLTSNERGDQEQVDLIFILLSPLNDGPFHLRRLSRISRLFQDDLFCERLRYLEDRESIRAQFLYPVLEEQAA